MRVCNTWNRAEGLGDGGGVRDWVRLRKGRTQRKVHVRRSALGSLLGQEEACGTIELFLMVGEEKDQLFCFSETALLGSLTVVRHN